MPKEGSSAPLLGNSSSGWGLLCWWCTHNSGVTYHENSKCEPKWKVTYRIIRTLHQVLYNISTCTFPLTCHYHINVYSTLYSTFDIPTQKRSVTELLPQKVSSETAPSMSSPSCWYALRQWFLHLLYTYDIQGVHVKVPAAGKPHGAFCHILIMWGLFVKAQSKKCL